MGRESWLPADLPGLDGHKRNSQGAPPPKPTNRLRHGGLLNSTANAEDIWYAGPQPPFEKDT